MNENNHALCSFRTQEYVTLLKQRDRQYVACCKFSYISEMDIYTDRIINIARDCTIIDDHYIKYVGYNWHIDWVRHSCHINMYDALALLLEQ